MSQKILKSPDQKTKCSNERNFFMISGQIIGDYIIGDPILIPNKTPGKSRKYTHDLRCQYCDGQYVAPSRVALRKHVSRYHREVHRWVNEQSK